MEIGLLVAAVFAATAFAAGGVGVPATFGAAPIKLVVSRHIGWEVNKTTRGKICAVASNDECQSRKPSREAGGFEYPSSVATNVKTGNLYVTDLDNFRVQEFTATGTFLSMFGWGVNETKDKQAGAAQWERNVCTAVSGDLCKAGALGGAAGQLSYPSSVTVDPITGDVYVLELGVGVRVDKYTADGRFLWMIGKDVNQTTKGNFCSEREIVESSVKCQVGESNGSDSLEPGAFKSAQQYGDLLAVGGPEHLLYVADEHRVQEFDTEGKWKREILLVSISSEPEANVATLAVDKSGDVYLVYQVPSLETGTHVEAGETIRKFNRRGEQVALFSVNPRRSSAIIHIDGIAMDSAGLMAVIGAEADVTFAKRFGLLYDAQTGLLMSEFAPPSDDDGLTLGSKDDLYVAATDDQEIAAYVPAPLMELVTSPVPCELGTEPAVAFNCALSG